MSSAKQVLQWGIGLAGIAILLVALIFSFSMLPKNESTPQPAELLISNSTRTPQPISPTATLEQQDSGAIAPGDWVATTDFGKLVFTVDKTGQKITRVSFQFSDWVCGDLPHSAEIVDGSRWEITDNSFSISTTFDRLMQNTMLINGTYDASNQKFSGDWEQAVHATICSGTWEASPGVPEAQISSPTAAPLPETYIVQEGDTWAGIASAFGRSVQYLQTLNGKGDLYVGQVLRIRPVVYPPESPPEVIPEGAIVVDYFALGGNQDYSTVKALADEFNNSQSVYYVRVSEEEATFGLEGFTSEQILERFDCFAGGLEHPQTAYNLDSLIETDAEGAALLEDIPADLWADVRRNGSIYGLPVASQPLVIYYNQDHFEKLGLETPAPGWTVDNFWSLASAASVNSVYGFVPVEDYSFLFKEHGIDLIDTFTSPPKTFFNTPGTIEFVTMLAKQFEKGVIPQLGTNYVFSLDGERGWHIQDNGLAAMWTFWGGFPSGGYEPHGYAVGVAPLPLGEGDFAPPRSAISIYISHNANSPEGCWQWAKYLSSQPIAFFGVPVRQSVLNSSSYEAAIGLDAAIAYRAAMQQPTMVTPENETEQAWQFPIYPLRLMWSATLVTIFNGANPGLALDELQRKGEVYLNCIDLANLSEGTPSYSERVDECALQADSNYNQIKSKAQE